MEGVWMDTKMVHGGSGSGGGSEGDGGDGTVLIRGRRYKS